MIQASLSAPKAYQIGDSALVSNGEVYVKYVIYPDGNVVNVSKPFRGYIDLENFLGGVPWALVVLSNGQLFNITRSYNQGLGGSWGLYDALPYYAQYPLDPANVSTWYEISSKGLSANPVYTFFSIEPSYPSGEVRVPPTVPTFGDGTVAAVPVRSGYGWLNFTVFSPPYTSSYFIKNSSDIEYQYFYTKSSLGVLLTNHSGTKIAIVVNWTIVWGYIEWHLSKDGGGSGPWYSYSPPHISIQYEVLQWNHGQFEYIYGYSNDSVSTVPAIKLLYPSSAGTHAPSEYFWFTLRVAIHFAPESPAQVYMWVGSYNGSGFTWSKLYFKELTGQPVPKVVTYYWPRSWSGEYKPIVYWVNNWTAVTAGPSFPVNVYGIYVSASNLDPFSDKSAYYPTPIDLMPNSVILIVPANNDNWPPTPPKTYVAYINSTV
jgi:hypothetical protein